MRTLYHFVTSPFSRRVRLALAHKKLDVVLRDCRAEPAANAELGKLWPLRTVPVLVDDGAVLGDSVAIAHYLDEAYPSAPRIWPADARALRSALEMTMLADGALTILIDLGMRYHALHSHADWKKVEGEMIGRAQGALNALGERVEARGTRTLTDAGWGAADMAVFTAAKWVEGLAARAPTNPHIAQIVSLPWSMPASLLRWAEPFQAREDVKALG